MLTLADLLSALSSNVPIQGAEGVAIRAVCIDSRQATRDSLFVALRGERADGHDFVPSAFEAGASVALVERPIEGVTSVHAGAPLSGAPFVSPVAVVVPDALRALQRFAAFWRLQHPDVRVVAVTGSVGKTTAKEAIAAVLAQRYRTLKSVGNYNNEIGLPLTLMELREDHQRAVLEMGMYAQGEIAQLCTIAQPQVGVVMNVEPVHLERLGTIERIAEAKAELIDALPSAGIAVLNGDDGRVGAMASRTRARVLSFGLEGNRHVWADEIESGGLEGVHFRAHVRQDAPLALAGSSQAMHIRMLGRHAVLPALAATTVGLAEGLTWSEVQAGLDALDYGLRLVPRTGLRGARLLDDTYNASPTSTCAALDLLGELPGRHIAVLGDMLELGSQEAAGHRQVGRCSARVLDMLITVGQRARLIAEEALEARPGDRLEAAAVHAVADNQSAIVLLQEAVRKGDQILIKGSRGMAMEEIVQALKGQADGA
ncbi:MAG: UDP-N-acetylmuramoyl-tripeptide--D-alanyl-D-alanine ligase [Anaerolineae bacterium]|nr:UDP-N-acetylmuramoyl-tripeptide--D-alanyl-D-alanine ligase [Anaerolineae bacterium]